MNIFKYKYIAHRLVNYIFYIVVFILGFIAGISMSSVNAADYSSTNDSGYYSEIINELGSPKVTEEYIYNLFEKINNDKNFNLDFNSFANNIIIKKRTTNLYQTQYNFCSEFSGSVKSPMCKGQYLTISLYTYNGTASVIFKGNYNTEPYGDSGNANKYYSSNTNLTGTYTTLDFSSYGKLEFNESLFENDSNFKKVCVDGKQSFSITPTFKNDTGQYEDFIWFPYGLNNGLYRTQYDSKSEYFEGNVIVDTDEARYENFYFKDKETIDEFYNYKPISVFEQAGYTDKYSYYGYDAYKFFIVMKEDLKRFPIFTFDNPSKTTISASGIEHGGGGLHLGEDNQIIKEEENYCFYIKNGYDVTYVNTDIYGDFNATGVPTPDGPIDINTSYNQKQDLEGNEFFDNFNDNDHGLSSIITMPLNLIKKISNGTCTPVKVEMLGTSFEMPCGDTVFWGREDLKTFKTFWNMFWGGIICYGIGVSLFKLVQKLKDPNSDKVEVIDL